MWRKASLLLACLSFACLPSAALADPLDTDPNPDELVPLLIVEDVQELDPEALASVASPVDEPVMFDGAVDRCYRRVATLAYKYGDNTAFYFRQTKDWCVANGKIESVSVTPSGHVYGWANWAWHYEGVIGSVNNYYNNRASHYSYRQGRFTYDACGFTCGSREPEIIIRSHANGSSSVWAQG